MRITDRIVADLEKGVRAHGGAAVECGQSIGPGEPAASSQRTKLTGLQCSASVVGGVASGFMSSTWMTLRQANELGAHVA
ncbi:ArdC-like ssDNA-binding domain-containing protein [Agrobacterium tumefaciens]|uniref:ArdC-like ssDNA-binding domain-containing protein n=1 Tax=Agrobacterium tumefaciens TaxID=358 RepID=UPI0021CDF0AC|nr:ArdC-like ssDNA-binding domain-containing protein [Agrobacterium tumefaciens]